VIGLLMHLLFRREETEKATVAAALPEPEGKRPLRQNALYFAAMVAILVFANWGRPVEAGGLLHAIYSAKWAITSAGALALGVILAAWFGVRWWKLLLVALPVALLAILVPGKPLLPFAAGVVGLSLITSTDRGEAGEWFGSSWGFTK